MKKILTYILFISLNVFIISKVTDIVVPKALNRYYMLEKYLESVDNEFDIQVYGSCHAYTSFNPTYLKENYNLDAFVYANPSEIIPVTYLRMLENFKNYKPNVAFVEIWGINPYETYEPTERVLNKFLEPNLERLPLTKEKIEVIKDFNKNFLEMNIPIMRYKDRLMNNSIYQNDFEYTFEGTLEQSDYYVYPEMVYRLSNNGYKIYKSKDLSDYPQKQNKVEDDDYMKLESRIEKYIDKIIALCAKYDVKLIFYRTPYISTENELRKLNYLKNKLEKENVTFIDLEKEIKFNYKTDFTDEHHLSTAGANKATKYLTEKFLINI